MAHHGSQNNLSSEVLSLIDCSLYLVSTNGAYFCHPDREAIGRIIKYGGKKPTLYFNYRTQYNDVWARQDLQEKYRYASSYPDGGGTGRRLSLL